MQPPSFYKIIKINLMQKLKLIDGEFSSTEFKQVLSNLFLNRIEFHERNNFSSQERFGIEEPTNIKRIAELNQSMEQLFEIFFEAEKNNQRLVILSEIHVSFADSEIPHKKANFI